MCALSHCCEALEPQLSAGYLIFVDFVSYLYNGRSLAYLPGKLGGKWRTLLWLQQRADGLVMGHVASPPHPPLDLAGVGSLEREGESPEPG